MSVYLHVIIDALSELADTSYQERVWAGQSASEMSSFDECVERLFDDSGLVVALDQGMVFGDEADALFRQLGRLIESVEVARPVGQLLRDPALDECRQLAGRILRELSTDGPGDV